MELESRVESALSRERLDQLKPGMEEMFKNTRRATMWYNEAVWTAARLFVEAAQESQKFRQSFVSEEKEEVPAFPNEDESSTVETDAWRSVMAEETPEYHEKVMGIGLSAFQGGSAENTAREILRD